MHLKKNKDFNKLLAEIRGTYREHADLSKTNWFNVGGPAEILYRPYDAEDLCIFLKKISKDIPITVLGVGSNILIRDGGIEGVVIKLGKNFNQIKIVDDSVEVGAAVLNYNFAVFCKDQGIGGLEFLVGIPGSIGGSLAMNAGAYGSDVSQVLMEAELIDSDGNVHNLRNVDIGYIYRGNTMPDGWIFTKGKFKFIKDTTENIAAKMEAICKAREESQPIRTKTSGSTFKNPQGYKAWELIDKAGCRGLRIGGAMISEKHCNFIINDENATAEDIENLGETVRQKVKETSGINLEWEIKIIGKK